MAEASEGVRQSFAELKGTGGEIKGAVREIRGATQQARGPKSEMDEFRRARDKALGTGRFTKWPKCMVCGKRDGWYAVGKPRHVRAPMYSRWWNGGSNTIPTQRFACVYCEARADLVQDFSWFYFLHA